MLVVVGGGEWWCVFCCRGTPGITEFDGCRKLSKSRLQGYCWKDWLWTDHIHGACLSPLLNSSRLGNMFYQSCFFIAWSAGPCDVSLSWPVISVIWWLWSVFVQNPRYNFWSHSFTRCAPEIEKLFESVARSCMGPPMKASDDDLTASLTVDGLKG